ncbi:MAG TPA: pyridoxamine 5'-phosphate oxidase [Dermatophilaceae bacterium]|nr:pyridoxamine 5'-phosphate oxidase [Dermatophilaceae bacterium]
MSDVRRWDYTGEGLSEDQVAATPWQQADDWIRQAEEMVARNEALHEPTSMAVATVDAQGLPDVREVLLRFFTPAGPGFVTSRHSAKAAQIAVNPVMAASLTWSPLFRAIRFRGGAQELPADVVDGYWGSRPWGSRISAWVSKQSHPIASRADLERQVAELSERWPDRGSPDDVPVPPDWVGYRLVCDEVEFWAGRSDRLHDRFRFTRIGEGDLDTGAAWSRGRLQP